MKDDLPGLDLLYFLFLFQSINSLSPESLLLNEEFPLKLLTRQRKESLLGSGGTTPRPPSLLPDAQAGGSWEAGLEGWPQGSEPEGRKKSPLWKAPPTLITTSTHHKAGCETLSGNYLSSICFYFFSHLGGLKAKTQ